MAEYDKSTFDPKAAAEARKAEMEEMTTKLEQGVKDIFTTDGYKDYLNFCAKLPRYSVNNERCRRGRSVFMSARSCSVWESSISGTSAASTDKR